MSIYDDRIPKQAAKVEHTAASSFVSDKPPPLFQPNNYPVDKFFDGDLDQRKHNLYTTSNVEGHIFRYQNRFMTMNEVRIGFDCDDDIEELTPLLTGALGIEVSRSTPVSSKLSDALADTLVLVTEEESASLRTIAELPADCFQDHENPRKHVINRPFADKVFLARLPLSCPRVRGVDILEGPTISPEVIASLEEYHPRAGVWAKVHSIVQANKLRSVKPSTINKLDTNLFQPDNSKIPCSLEPTTNISPLMYSGDDEDEDSLYNQTTERICAVKERNITKYKKNNPGINVTPLARPQDYTQVFQGAVARPTQPATKETLLQGKHKRAVMSHRLMLAALNKREETVNVPDLTERFLICWETSDFESVVRDYKNSILDFCKERTQNTRDYFSVAYPKRFRVMLLIPCF